jgi:hypothetical protein
MSAMMEAPRMTPQSHRLLSLHLPLRCREPSRHRLLKRLLLDHDHLWTHHVHPRQHHPKETRPCLMEGTTIPTATTRPASHRHLLLALSPPMPRQFLRGSLSSQRTTAQTTCTLLLRHADPLSVHPHHHLVHPNSRRQCLQCHSQPFLHGRHQDNLSMCHGLL